MFANLLKKSFLSAVVFVLLFFVFADCASTAEGDDELVRDLGNGIRLEFKGVRANPGVSSFYPQLVLNIVSEVDSVIKIGKNAALYDANGNKSERVREVTIGNSNTMEREIIGEVLTPVYISMSGCSPTETFPRVDCEVNGKKLTFRNVPLISN